jgi:hypothetical protein
VKHYFVFNIISNMRVTDPPASLWRPLTPSSSARLFLTGATVGPVVDSLHNQCLLTYNVAPITLDWPTTILTAATTTTSSIDMSSTATTSTHLFASSWTVFPLLGIAYVVLGGLLPRIFEYYALSPLLAAAFLPTATTNNPPGDNKTNTTRMLLLKSDWSRLNESASAAATTDEKTTKRFLDLKSRAILAVVTTALIIKLSEYLTLHHPTTTNLLPSTFGGVDALQQHQDVLLLLLAALSQWAVLDGSLPALLAASLTSIGGPLAELPFVASGIWEYLPTAADYFPLQDFADGTSTGATGAIDWLLQNVLGTPNYQHLGLSSITGPCYFAVTIDAIELGRWFDSMDNDHGDQART